MTPEGPALSGDSEQRLDGALTIVDLANELLAPIAAGKIPWLHLPVFFETETGDHAITDVRFEHDRVVLLGEEGT